MPRWQIILAWTLALISALLCITAHLRLDYTVIDDAFITYRYAGRLASGDGLTYNDGERILGTTTPGYALLLAGVGAVGGVNALPVGSRLLNLLCLLLAGGFAALIARQFTRQPLLLSVVFCLFTLSPKTLVASFSGMESAFFMVLLCAGFLALLRERWLVAALLLGLLPVVRPEGVFVVGLTVLLLAWMWLRAKMNRQDAKDAEKVTENRLERPSWPVLTGCLLLLGAPFVLWAAIATAYYGSPLPHSIVAKQAGLYPIGMIGSFLSLMGGFTETYFLVLMLPNSLSRLPQIGVPFSLLFFVAFLVVVVIGMRFLWRKSALFGVLALFIGVMLVFYATSETLIFPQYYAFFEPLTKLCWWAGIAVILVRIIRRTAVAWTVSAVIVLFPAFVLYPYNSVAQPTMDLHELEVSTLRQPLYRSIAQQLDPLLPEGIVVLTPEIGELGFYLPRVHILDSAGLVSDQAIAYFPIPEALRTRSGVIPPGLVQDYQPDLIVTLDVFIPPGMLESEWFTESYTAVIVWRYDWLPLGSEEFFVFSRNDFAAGMALAGMDLEMSEPAYVR